MSSLPPRLRAYRGVSTAVRVCTEKGWGTPPPLSPPLLLTTEDSPEAQPHILWRGRVEKSKETLRTDEPMDYKREVGCSQIQASAGDSPTSDAQRTLVLSAGDTPAITHLGCSVDTQAYPNLAPSWHQTGNTPEATLAHNGPPAPLLATPQPQATKALRGHLSLCWGHPGLKPSWHSTDTCGSWALTNLKPSWHLARPGTANAGGCPTRGQRSQTLSASVRF